MQKVIQRWQLADKGKKEKAEISETAITQSQQIAFLKESKWNTVREERVIVLENEYRFQPRSSQEKIILELLEKQQYNYNQKCQSWNNTKGTSRSLTGKTGVLSINTVPEEGSCTTS